MSNNKKKTRGRDFKMITTTKVIGISVKAVGTSMDKNNTAMKDFIKKPYCIVNRRTKKESPTNLLGYFPIPNERESGYLSIDKRIKLVEKEAEKFCAKYRDEDYLVNIITSKSSVKIFK